MTETDTAYRALALQIAEETDARMATLPPDRLWPRDPDSPLYAVRASHRSEHLDDIEAALRRNHTEASILRAERAAPRRPR